MNTADIQAHVDWPSQRDLIPGASQYGGYDDLAIYAAAHFKFLVFFKKEWNNWAKKYVPTCRKLPLADTNQGEMNVELKHTTYSHSPNWLQLTVGS